MIQSVKMVKAFVEQSYFTGIMTPKCGLESSIGLTTGLRHGELRA